MKVSFFYHINLSHCITLFFSYWMKLCQENLRERNRIQQELMNARLPQEALDVWGMKEFGMHERVFEMEEKLMKARKQFQKIAADVDDWASLDYLRWKRDSTLEEIRKQNKQRNIPPSYAIPALSKGVKLPPIGKPVVRVTASYKHPNHANAPVLSTALRSQEKVCAIPDYSTGLRKRVLEEVHLKETFDLKKAPSRIPVRKTGLTTEDFLSFWSPKQTKESREQSRLPLPVICVSKATPDLDIATTIYSSQNLMQSSDRKLKDVDLSYPKKTKRDKSLHAPSQSNIILQRIPSPPARDGKRRTSTKLRRCHYKQSTSALPQL